MSATTPAATTPAAANPASATHVRIDQGELAGIEHPGVLRFAGIPFAAPPVGPRRYLPPEPHEGWSGVRDATATAAICPQPPMMLAQLLGEEAEPEHEDCLFLNVFTPACDDAARPVMVWIHGGGFMMGSGSSAMYDGAHLVRRGDVVVVTINYRLGALGFLHTDDLGHGQGTANAGIADQVQALRWVHDNIAAFGGDPGNVTIFGESAGAMSVGTLLGTPAARGLFHRAILQSGAAHNVSTLEHATGVREALLARLGGGGLERLHGAPIAELMTAQSGFFMEVFARVDERMAAGHDPVLLPFQPTLDGVVLPEPPLDAVRAGAAARVPVLVGTNLDEWKLFAIMDATPIDEDLLGQRLGALLGPDRVPEVLEVYRSEFPDASPADLFGAGVTDLVFRQPAIRLAETQLAHTSEVYTYLFTWATQAFGGALGSCHALEVPFVFGNREGLGMLLGEEPPASLGDAMQDAWLAFARNGNPSTETLAWPAYTTTDRATMILDATCTVTHDPEGDRRRLWDGLV